jgi:putative transposase
MKTQPNSYKGYRYPGEIISHTVWLYHRFTLSFRDIEDLLAERGIVVTYETIRQWRQKFGLSYAKNLRKKQHKLGDTWFMDEVFLNINGQRQYLWRAVDQDSDVVDIPRSKSPQQKSRVEFFS